MIGYFYEPQWLFARRAARARSRCRRTRRAATDDPAEVDCDYPPDGAQEDRLDHVRGGRLPAVDLVEKFTWTNEDQNLVAKYISDEGMSNEDAAAEVGRGEPRQGGCLARLSPLT